jgi:serine/threonine protein phosphatase PrpC
MEDEYCVVQADGYTLLAIFDGHGGGDASRHCRERLHTHIHAALSHRDATGALSQGLERLEEEIMQSQRKVAQAGSEGACGMGAGTTAVAVLLTVDSPPSVPCASPSDSGSVRPEAALPPSLQSSLPLPSHGVGTAGGGATAATTSTTSPPALATSPSAVTDAQLSTGALTVAWVGDCRAVLCHNGSAISLTVDHTTANPTELARILAAGGSVEDGRLGGCLAVARALGGVVNRARHAT